VGDGKTRALSVGEAQAAVLKANLGSSAGRGINFEGGQRWVEGTHSVNNPGMFDADYWYPGIARDGTGGQNSFEYLKSRGVGVVRLGIRWERVQPRLGGSLDATELGRFKAAVSAAGAAGLKVVLDLHNYGGFWHGTSGGWDGTGKTALNTSACTKTHFRDLWKRLSNQFRTNNVVVAYDLMNEPIGKGGIQADSGKTAGKTWEDITKLVFDDVRALGDNKTIMVPFYPAGVGQGNSYHPTGPWMGTRTILMYTAHQYFDRYFEPGSGGGKYVRSYAEENTYYASKGY
jgi:aryl-phospho-beta-D-glucosidase BglC (GH1 family)